MRTTDPRPYGAGHILDMPGYGLMHMALVCLMLITTAFHGVAAPQTGSAVTNKHINDILRDGDGYIWIATAKGLNKYNGYEYFHYFHRDDTDRTLPSDLITALYTGPDGALWVATDYGICRYDKMTDDFTPCCYPGAAPSVEYGFIEDGDALYTYGTGGIKRVADGPDGPAVEVVPGTGGMVITHMVRDHAGGLWLNCLATGAVYHAEGITGPYRPVDGTGHVAVNCLFIYNRTTLWAGTGDGMTAIDTRTKSIRDTEREVRFSRMNISFFHRAGSRILIGTRNAGLYIYDPDTGTLTPSTRHDLFADLASTHCTCCCVTPDEMIWLGTFDQGYYTEPGTPRRFNGDRLLDRHLSGRFVTRIAEAADGSLWFGTRYDGLIHYDPVTRELSSYTRDNFRPFADAGSDFVQSLMVDSRGSLWVGYEKSLMRCTVAGGRILGYEVFDVRTDVVTLAEDSRGRVWTGSSTDGITVYDPGGYPPRRVALPNPRSNVTRIIRLARGEMLFSCYEDGLYLAEPETFEIRRFPVPEPMVPYTRRCITLMEAASGALWIGTYTRGAARLDPDRGSFELFPSVGTHADNDVLALAEQDDGQIWLSTSFGLSRYNPQSGRFTTFDTTDGLGGDQFHEKAVLTASDGRIYFGGNHGVTFFDPSDVTAPSREVRIMLEDFRIANRSITPGDGTGILDRSVMLADSILLRYDQSVFSIDYSALDFGPSRRPEYAYILHDFDRQWNYVGDFRRASYTNIPAGEYVFEVRAIAPDGQWVGEPRRLYIRVKPAPWLHPAALTAYLVAITGLIMLFIHLRVRNRIQRERIALIEQKSQQEQHINDMKIKFFTNISHEIRTPLSMIYGPVKKLLGAGIDRQQRDKLLNLLNHNTDNLLRLVDQVMDFAKLESDTLALTVHPAVPGALAREIVQSYHYFAREKDITIITGSLVGQEVTIDADKYRKILTNLVSNALKYTPAGGTVTLEQYLGGPPEGSSGMEPGSIWLHTSVIDTGIGIGPEKMPYLFRRHHRLAAGGGSAADIPGKGIGLHYVKSLVDIHKGTIRARARGEGGMEFSFALPAAGSAYSASERIRAVDAPGLGVDAAPAGTAAVPGDPAPADGTRETVLVVEDNRDLLSFVELILGERYHVLSATDGRQALDIARGENLSLVVSDIIMPEMDGLELCSAIKNDPELCHIPVVLLTARTLAEQQIEGFGSGADAYINKPFVPELLLTVVGNLLENRARIRGYVLQRIGASEQPAAEGSPAVPAMEPGPLDREFLDKLCRYLDRDLSDSNINVNTLGRDLGFSRTSFYRKVKSLTGYTPTDFLRVYRLKKAAILLDSGRYTVNEVVDMTGFGTHSYFSLCFKKEYGVNPRDYRKRRAK